MKRFLAALGMTLACAVASADVAVPELKARVTDLTGTLTAEQRADLEQRLAAFEQRKGGQVAVLLVPTTGPETIEQYSLRVVEGWKLGRKGVDDGVLLLVAKDDRAMRIEVGYGLEGAVPDAIAKRIVEETITPAFRDGAFHEGISAGVDQLMRVIDGEPLPEPKRRRAGGVDGEGLLMLGFVLLMLSHAVGRAIGEAPSALGAGALYGVVIAWLVDSLVFGGIAAVALFAFSLLSQLGGHGGGGWSSGGLGGGFRGGGGFGGGGGSFGGGGASGRW